MEFLLGIGGLLALFLFVAGVTVLAVWVTERVSK